jgi:ABC-type lipoprotein export system ATPase subunit
MVNSTLLTPKASGSAPAVALRDVRKVYGRGDGAVVALDGVSAALSAGSFTAIMGPSGSGKSTLLNVAAGLDRPNLRKRGARRHRPGAPQRAAVDDLAA